MPTLHRVFQRTVAAALVATGLVLSADVPVASDVRPPPEPPPVAVEATADDRPLITVAVATSRPIVALTFDDGPDPRWTPQVLDELRRAGARATFFVTGEHARAHPDLLQAIVASGSEIANHTDTHPRMDGLDAEAVAGEVRLASEAIGAAGVAQAPFFRPPRGRYGSETIAGVGRTGLATVGWTVCLERWLRRVGPDAGPMATVADLRPGGVVLAHDGGIPDRSATVRALPAMLGELAARGYEVVSLSELVRWGPPIVARPGSDPRDAPVTGPTTR